MLYKRSFLLRSNQEIRWHKFNDFETLVDYALSEIRKCSFEALENKRLFRIVLAGGNTPKALYETMKELKTNWKCWQIYYGDERCYPKNHPELNSSMAKKAFLDHVPINKYQIFEVPGWLGPEIGAKSYSHFLKNVGEFDLVLLGLGEDGHTASLFPNHFIGEKKSSDDVLFIKNAPKPPPERISLSANRLSRTKKVIFLVSGEDKWHIIHEWQKGKSIPASFICPERGVDVLFTKQRIGV